MHKSMASHIVSGLVLDAANHNQGAGGLRVEAHDLDGVVTDLVGYAVTDGDGRFEMELEDEDVLALFGDRVATAYFVVINPGTAPTLLLSTEQGQHWNVRSPTAEVRFLVDTGRGTATTLQALVVQGAISDAMGEPLVGKLVKAFDRRLGGDTQLGSTQTSDARGRYRVEYAASAVAPKVHGDLYIAAFEPTGGTLVLVGDTRCQAPPTYVTGLSLAAAYPGRTESERLGDALQPYLGTLTLDGLTDDQIAQLACTAGHPVEHVRALCRAAAIEAAASALGRHIPYALIRVGLPETRREFLTTPVAQVRAALVRAGDAGLLPAMTTSAVTAYINALVGAMTNLAKEAPVGNATCSFYDVIRVALDQSTADSFLDAYCRNESSLGDFWNNVSLSTTNKTRLQLTLQWGALTRYHKPLIDWLEGQRSAGTTTTLRQLAMFDETDWLSALNAITAGAPYPYDLPPLSGTATARKQNYATLLTRTMEAQMPTANIHGRIKKANLASDADVITFFDNNLNFEFGSHRSAAFVSSGAILTGINTANVPALTARLEQIERLAKLTVRYPEQQVLLADGIGSAHGVTRLGRDQFVARYQSAIGSSSVADEIYTRAEAQVANATALRAKYGAAANLPSLAAVQSWGDPPGSPGLLVDWEVLFGTLNQCACSECCSIFSPTAYLVDLLEFLRRHDSDDPWTPKRTALDTLLARRPDIAALKLSCANTKTALPHIDLVNELLEREVHPFTPAQLAGAFQWLRADLGVTLNGNAVSAWIDQISGTSWQQGTSANRPGFNGVDNDFLGRPCLSFDGTNDALAIASGLTSSSTSFTAHFVVKSATADSTDRCLLSVQTGRLDWNWSQTSSTGKHSVKLGSTDYNLGVPATTGTQYVTIIVDQTAGKLHCYVNGTQLPDVSNVSGFTAFGGAAAIGSLFNTGSNFSGKIAEVVLCTGVSSAADLAQAFSYFSTRYGLPGPVVAVETGRETPDLLAMPERIDSAAYDVLGAAAYPWALPFSLRQAEARAYLAHLGTRRDEVMRVFQRPVRPSELGGCILWLRSDRGVTGSSGSVSGWRDHSGLGNDAAQAATGLQPSVGANGANGRPYVSFGGAQALSIPHQANLNASVATIVAVVSNSVFGQVIMKGRAGSVFNYGVARNSTGGGTAEANYSNHPQTDGAWAAGGNAASLYIAELTTDHTRYRLNGSETLNGNETNVLGQGSFPVVVGAYETGNAVYTNYFTGRVYEVIVFNRALTTAETQQIEAYAFDRYGIQAASVAVTPTDLQVSQERLELTKTDRLVMTGQSTLLSRELWGFSADQVNGQNWYDILKGVLPPNGTGVSPLLQRSGMDLDELQELLESKFILGYATATPTLDPSGVCDPGQLAITNLQSPLATSWDFIQRFLRLRNRLGWSIADLDKIVAGLSGTMNDVLIASLGQVVRVQERLPRVPLEELAAWWGSLDVQSRPLTKLPSLYARVFLNQAIGNAPAGAGFDSSPGSISVDLTVAANLQHALAAVGMSPADYALLTDNAVSHALLAIDATLAGVGPYTLGNLSRLYRLASFSRATRLSAADARVLQMLTNLAPLAGDVGAASAGPEQATLFLDKLEKIRSAGFAVDELHYLLRHVARRTSGAVTDDALIATRLAQLDAGLAPIVQATTYPTDSGGAYITDTSGAKLSALLTEVLASENLALSQMAVKDKAEGVMAIVLGTSALSAAQQRSKLDEVLAPILGDITPIKDELVFRPNEIGTNPSIADGTACRMWLEPSSLHVTSGKVDSWTDLSSHGTSVIQNNTTYQPAFVSSGGPFGFAAADLDGTHSYLGIAATYSSTSHSFFAVVRERTRDATGRSVFDKFASNGDPNERLTLAASLPSPNGTKIGYYNNATWYPNADDSLGDHMLTWIFDATGSGLGAHKAVVDRDGVQLNATLGDYPSPVHMAAASNYLGLGGWFGVGVGLFDGMISVAGLFERVLTTTERRRIPDYIRLLAGQPAKLRFEIVHLALLNHVRQRDAAAFVKQALAAALGIDAAAVSALLTQWLTAFSDSSKTLIADFLPPAVESGSSSVSDANRKKAMTRITKVATLVAKLALTADEIAWIHGAYRDFGWLNFNDLPVVAETSADVAVAQARFSRFERLLDLVGLRDTLKAGRRALLELFQLSTTGMSEASFLDELAARTGWPRADIPTATGWFDVFYPDDYRNETALRRLADAFALLRRVGTTVSTALVWLDVDGSSANLTAATDAIKLAKAKHDKDSWPDIGRKLRDPLREAQRDALVAYVVNKRGKTVPDDLLGVVLADVEVSPCQLTSRIRFALSGIQLFIQRCILGLEHQDTDPKGVKLGQVAAEEYAWMKTYRVWEAARRVFVYPENWIRPELRDNKTAPFRALESTLRQNDITDERAEAAYKAYLDALDLIARLNVAGVAHEMQVGDGNEEPSIDVLHVFARTNRGAPRALYYRQLVDGASWTSWEKIDLDVSPTHLIPVVHESRLRLFWPSFEDRAKPDNAIKDDSQPPITNALVTMTHADHESDRWSPPQRTVKVAVLPGMKPPEWTDDPYTWISFALEVDANGEPISIAVTGANSGAGPDTAQEARTPYGRFVFSPCGAGVDVRSDNLNALHLDSPDGAFDVGTDFVIGHSLGLGSTVALKRRHALQDTVQTVPLINQAAAGAIITEAHPAVGESLPTPFTNEFFYRDADHRFFVQGRNVVGRLAEAALPPSALMHVDFLAKNGSDLAARVSTELRDYNRGYNHSIQAVRHRADPAYRFFSFEHRHMCDFRGALYRKGVLGLLRWNDSAPIQLRGSDPNAPDFFNFLTTYAPTPIVAHPYPADDVDFSYRGAYSTYNWELFFHVPFLIASRLVSEQRFSEARRWWHAIFDPTSTNTPPSQSNPSSTKRFWKVRPFFENDDMASIQAQIDNANPPSNPDAQFLKQILGGQSGGEFDLSYQIAAWRKDPFNPHAVARLRPLAYQKATVMAYLDTLIQWADALFQQYTLETVGEATQLYILASSLLGPRPVFPDRGTCSAEQVTYNAIQSGAVSLMSEKNENVVSASPEVAQSAPATQAPPLRLFTGLFCVPPNDKLLSYWDTVEDRLFKIRHCMTIEGVVQELPLFEPPIDPALLVAAAAAGVDLSSVVADLKSPPPLYRLMHLLPKAVEFTQSLIGLGASLLGALEKNDGESLARLRQTQEISVLELVRDTRKAQIDEAKGQLDALQKGRAVTQARFDYYHTIERVSAGEAGALALAKTATIQQAVGQGFQAMAGIAHLVPMFQLGTSGVASPVTVTSFGGSNFGLEAEASAAVFNIVASLTREESSATGTRAGWDRRWNDWKLQEELAKRELEQVDKQIAAAQLRVEIAERELQSHDKQIENAKEIEDFLKSKFTNEELYTWQLEQLSETYFQAYKLAYALARSCERAFQFERAEPTATFVNFGGWDSRRKGLVAGEKLLLDLRRLESAYLQQNRREYELVKHISLAEEYPDKLLELRATGTTTLTLSEDRFDIDYPGHYLRRIKTVSMTVPAVTGPHTSVHSTLTLTGSRIRISSDPSTGYAESGSLDDKRFLYNFGVLSSVCTSGAQNDAGMFELNFRDERYLPFEGSGAISSWRIEMPAETNRFDLNTVTDVVLHLSYTAREGGGRLKDAARKTVLAGLPEQAVRIFSVANEFAAAWFAFQSLDASHNQVLSLSFAGKLPYLFGKDATTITKVRLCSLWAAKSTGIDATNVKPPSGGNGTNVLVQPAADLTANVTYAGEGAATWTITVPQSTISASSFPSDLREVVNTVNNVTYYRIKPDQLLDLFLIVDLQRQAP